MGPESSLDAARARGLAVVGVIISHTEPELSAADAANLDVLRTELDLLGEVDWSDAPTRGVSLDGDALWRGLSNAG